MRSGQVICIKSTLDNPGTESDQMLSAASITIPIPTTRHRNRNAIVIVIEPVPALYAHDATLIPEIAEAARCGGPLGGIPRFSVTGAAVSTR
jgi:hypothetical protein